MKKGFTLVELLLVVSIIALLSSIVISSTKTARIKAAEAKADVELQALNTAYELFRSTNNRYPIASGKISQSTLKDDLVPDYISSIPTIPGIISDKVSTEVDYDVVSNGQIATNGSVYYRCGPGNSPDAVVTWYPKYLNSNDAPPLSRQVHLSTNPNGPYNVSLTGLCGIIIEQDELGNIIGGGSTCTYTYMYCVPQY